MSTKIGVDGLVYAIMTTEDTKTAAPVYGEVQDALGVMSLNINPNGSVDTLFADNGPSETASTLGKIDVEIKKSALTTRNLADMLGHAIDSKGGLVYGGADVPPWLAIGFRSLKANGKYRYSWLYKGKFTEPEDQNETKGDSINFQPDTIKGNFAKLNFAYTVGGTDTFPWRYALDQEDEDADATLLSNFLTAVVMPTADAVVTPTPDSAE